MNSLPTPGPQRGDEFKWGMNHELCGLTKKNLEKGLYNPKEYFLIDKKTTKKLTLDH